MPFKMCYDLDSKSLNFYLIPTDDQTMIDLIKMRSYIGNSILTRPELEKIAVRRVDELNMIKDVKYVGTLNTQTKLPWDAVIIDRKNVIEWIALNYDF